MRSSTPQRNSRERSSEHSDDAGEAIDYKKELIELWTKLQGIVDCLETWEEDFEWANQNPHKAYPSHKSEGLGRMFQNAQFRKRLNHADVDALVPQIRRLQKIKLKRNDLVDQRRK